VTDTQTAEQTVDPGTTEEQVATVTDMKPADAPAKAPKQPKPENPCGCRKFVAFDKSDPKAEFDTGCKATTPRNFTQGHDAKTASFLVEAQADGYGIKSADGSVIYSGALDAAKRGGLSEALVGKVERALKTADDRATAKAAKAAERDQIKKDKAEAKAKADAEKAAAKAAKANAPKEVAAKVVEGSQEGDATPTGGGRVTVKVGRHEYEGDLSEDGKTVTYLNNTGEQQERDVESVRILKRS
jgi:hypothetical protein